MGYINLILSWLFFGLIHSLTASLALKAWVTARWSAVARWYRLLFNLVALLTFLPVLLALGIAPDEPVLAERAGLYWLGNALLLAGIVVSIGALRGYDLNEFTGWPGRLPLTLTSDDLRQAGLLRYVRHPLYSGIVLTLVGLFLIHPSWKYLLFGAMGVLYLRIGIYFEERKLVRQFGNAYVNYRRKTPMLLPDISHKMIRSANRVD